MQKSYRAVHAVRPGRLELTEKPLLDPPPGHVRIRVEACGICHTDSATVEGAFPIQWPRVPGHEVVGVIDKMGEGVIAWPVGKRVGVGYLAGSCGHCAYCREGDLVCCQHQAFTGVQLDGGYAEVMIAKQSGLMAIPDALASVDAAPLLCAGLTTFGALRKAPAKAGDLVGVVGIGGLGHLGVQYARQMGFKVAAIGRGPEKEALAKKLGAHHYIDNTTADPALALQAFGGAALILVTASGGKAVAQTIGGLKPRGRVVVLGASPDPIELSTLSLLFASNPSDGSLTGAGRSVEGSMTGDPATGDETLKFSLLSGVAPMVEAVPLEKAAEGYARMMSGKATFRVVLTMN
jgi:propanol-preferring alcohol dehydrogenase